MSSPKHVTENLQPASLFYADDYAIDLAAKDLDKLARPFFSTHTARWAEKARAISQFLLIPFRKSLQLIAYSIQPSPGEDKKVASFRKAGPVRLLTGLLGITFLLVSIAFAITLFPFHLAALIAYKKRPVITYIKNAPESGFIEKPEMSQDKPLHVRTHNIGFVLESMRIVGDLRSVKQRAHELVDFVMNDEAQPDIICFQEAFHEDGTRILCEGLKNKYPYIITNVLPTASGFSSGAMIASKYPIMDLSFHCLKYNLGPERLSPRGVLRVKVDTDKGPVNIYQAHTQSIVGKDRSEVRDKQLQQIKQIMRTDFEKDNHPQIIMGDLNTSALDAWGNSNIADANNPEKAVQERLHQEFEDVFLKDHDPELGVRTPGSKSHFLAKDNARLALEKPLTEPTASWYAGLFAHKDHDMVSAGIHKKMKLDREKHHYTVEPVVEPEQEPTWGTKNWRTNQPANTSRFDYILFPRYKEASQLDGRAEIRRVFVPQDQQSAASDHLPVDGLIWQKQP